MSGTPAPECIPFDAPRNYEKISPAQADSYDAFFYISHKEANQHHLTISAGTALANAGIFTYTQRMASVTINDETTYFNIFTTTGSVTMGSSTFTPVTKAARAFEDVSKSIYIGQETSDGASVSVDEEPQEGVFAGHVSAWGSVQRVPNRQNLFDRFGYDLFALTSYLVPDRRAFISATMAPSGNSYVFSYSFSLLDSPRNIDAALYYRNTLNSGVAGGAINFDITILEWEGTIDREWNLLRSVTKENYTISALGAIKADVINRTEAVYYHYDDIAHWNDAVISADEQARIDLIPTE